LEREGTSPVDLPEALDSWANTESTPCIVLVKPLIITDGKRPRPDKAYVALQDIQ
jgi:hypothetical protein